MKKKEIEDKKKRNCCSLYSFLSVCLYLCTFTNHLLVKLNIFRQKTTYKKSVFLVSVALVAAMVVLGQRSFCFVIVIIIITITNGRLCKERIKMNEGSNLLKIHLDFCIKCCKSSILSYHGFRKLEMQVILKEKCK